MRSTEKSSLISYVLEKGHYDAKEFNDAFSEEVFDVEVAGELVLYSLLPGRAANAFIPSSHSSSWSIAPAPTRTQRGAV